VRSLVIGVGHRDRGDDGVAYEVVGTLRQRLGQEPLSDDADDVDGGDEPVRTLAVPQLAPEWLELARGRELLVFVDAHVIEEWSDLCCRPVESESRMGAFTHHLTPGMFLAMLEVLYGERPSAWLVSIRGRSFDFGRELSEACAVRVGPAVESILGLVTGSE
jgi:hydrogenase maturation protease